MRIYMRRRRGSRGYTLLDASLALLLGTSVAAASVAYKMDERADQRARAQGLAMVTLQGAVNQYLTDHFGELVKAGGGTVSGVATPRAPTVTELRTVGALKDPFSTLAFNGGSYRVQISTFPSGCTPPACNLDALIWIDRPIVDWRNNVDFPRLGVSVSTIGFDGAMSTNASPATLLGMQGKWSAANPAGTLAGLLAARTGYNSASYAQFYRRDGSLAMTNDIAAGGHSLNNANAVNANKVNLPAGNSLQVGSAMVYGDSANAAIRSPSGSVYLQDLNGNNGMVIAANGQFSGTLTSTNNNVSNDQWIGRNQSVSQDQWVGRNVNVGNSISSNLSYTNSATVWGNQTTHGYHYFNGPIVAQSMVYLPSMAWEGWGCSGNGITTDPSGQILQCRGGAWQAATATPGSLCGVQWNENAPTVSCSNLPWTGGPMPCPGGYVRTNTLIEGGNRRWECVKT